MNNGKEVCKRLKKVRRDIAKANHIPLVQDKCTHKGDCMGTCPNCEHEVRYLEQELAKRSKLGKAVSIIGIAAVSGTIALTASSCKTGDPVWVEPTAGIAPPEQPLTGDPAVPEDGYNILEASLPDNTPTDVSE